MWPARDAVVADGLAAGRGPPYAVRMKTLVLFLVTALISIKPTIVFLRWRKALRVNGALPAADEIKKTRRLVMLQAHIIPFIPLAAVFLARGY